YADRRERVNEGGGPRSLEFPSGEVQCRDWLARLLKHDYRVGTGSESEPGGPTSSTVGCRRDPTRATPPPACLHRQGHQLVTTTPEYGRSTNAWFPWSAAASVRSPILVWSGSFLPSTSLFGVTAQTDTRTRPFVIVG